MRRLLAILLLCLLPAGSAAARTPEPQVLTARFLAPPVPGGLAMLEVRVRDPLAAVNGMQVDFGDGRGASKQSACRPALANFVPRGPFIPGTPVTLHALHRYAAAGQYEVTITVTADDCVGGPRTHTKRFKVRVRPAPLPGLKPRAAQAPGCDNAFMEPSGDRSALRAATLCLVNALRAKRGLAALTTNKKLTKAARTHSVAMVARNFFAHETPEGRTLERRLRAVRYRPVEAGENIGAGAGTLGSPYAMVLAWWESPPHRANLLNGRFRDAGIGVSAGMPGEADTDAATYTLLLGRR